MTIPWSDSSVLQQLSSVDAGLEARRNIIEQLRARKTQREEAVEDAAEFSPPLPSEPPMPGFGNNPPVPLPQNGAPLMQSPSFNNVNIDSQNISNPGMSVSNPGMGMGAPGMSMGNPSMGSSGMGSSGMGSSGMGSSGMGSSGMGSSGMSNSGMGSSGMGNPGIGNPSLCTPLSMGNSMSMGPGPGMIGSSINSLSGMGTMGMIQSGTGMGMMQSSKSMMVPSMMPVPQMGMSSHSRGMGMPQTGMSIHPGGVAISQGTPGGMMRPVGHGMSMSQSGFRMMTPSAGMGKGMMGMSSGMSGMVQSNPGGMTISPAMSGMVQSNPSSMAVSQGASGLVSSQSAPELVQSQPGAVAVSQGTSGMVQSQSSVQGAPGGERKRTWEQMDSASDRPSGSFVTRSNSAPLDGGSEAQVDAPKDSSASAPPSSNPSDAADDLSTRKSGMLARLGDDTETKSAQPVMMVPSSQTVMKPMVSYMSPSQYSQMGMVYDDSRRQVMTARPSMVRPTRVMTASDLAGAYSRPALDPKTMTPEEYERYRQQCWREYYSMQGYDEFGVPDVAAQQQKALATVSDKAKGRGKLKKNIHDELERLNPEVANYLAGNQMRQNAIAKVALAPKPVPVKKKAESAIHCQLLGL